MVEKHIPTQLCYRLFGSSMILLHVERAIVVLLAAVALLLAIVSFRGLVPLTDPMTPLGYIDRLSLVFGLHEQAHVIIIQNHKWSVDVHLYTFQRRLKDGAFFLSTQKTETVASGLLDAISSEAVETKCGEILRTCDNVIPFTSSKQNIPILVGLPPMDDLSKEERKTLVSGLDTCFSNSEYEYNREGSLGTIDSNRQLVMQWFALSLLNGRLPYHKAAETPVLVETNEDDLHLTFAASSLSRVKNETIKRLQKVTVFGDTWDLVTIVIPSLGVHKARQLVLTGWNITSEGAASPCVNPVVDRWWEFRGHRYHVKGLNKSVEEVKERNGPFAGKRISRPVANYDTCHGVVLNFVTKILGKNYEQVIKDLKRRKVYMRGKLFVQCSERGLTDPYKGGDVKLKAYMDSLKHACKVPNTDQPFACVDMMTTGVVFDKVLGLHKASVLHTTQKVKGFLGDWPITAALQVYQNGL